MQLGIFAKTFPRPTLEETLDAVVSHGLTHIQFNMSCMGLATLPDKLDEGSCVWIAQTLHDRGLSMAAISGTFNMVDPNAARLENNLRRLEVLAEACRWLDARIITLCTGSLDAQDMWKWHSDNVRKSTWQKLVETMRKAVAIADRHEVTLAFEPEINNVVSSVMRARRLLDEIDSRWLKVVIDPANLLRSGDMSRLIEILDEAFDWIGSDIVLAHAKEPILQEVDKRALELMMRELVVWQRRATTRGLVEAVILKDDDVFKKKTRRHPSRKLREQPSFYFYHPYFTRLSRINYRGAIVIHGLEEGEIEARTALLRDTLKLVEPEAPSDADPHS